MSETGSSNFHSDISGSVNVTSIELDVLKSLFKNSLFLVEHVDGTVISAETGIEASDFSFVKLGSTEVDAFLGAVVMLGRQCSVFLENFIVIS